MEPVSQLSMCGSFAEKADHSATDNNQEEEDEDEAEEEELVVKKKGIKSPRQKRKRFETKKAKEQMFVSQLSEESLRLDDTRHAVMDSFGFFLQVHFTLSQQMIQDQIITCLRFA